MSKKKKIIIRQTSVRKFDRKFISQMVKTAFFMSGSYDTHTYYKK